MAARVLIAAAELEVFDYLEGEGSRPEDVAAHFGGSPRAFRIFLNALAALGVIEKRGDIYRNTPLASRHLVTSSPEYLGDGLRFRSHLWDSWMRLDEILRGQPARLSDLVEDPERNRRFIRAMHAYHFGEAKEIAPLLELHRAETMLDLGGGAASFSIAFCLEAPNLRVVLIDLPPTLEIARSYVEEHGLSDRIELRAGDFYHDPAFHPGGPYDLVFISHILHMEGESQNLELLRKIVSSTSPGGRIVVNEVPVEESRIEPLWGALFAVNMLVNTERGDSYPQSTIARWLEEAGCLRVEFLTDSLTVGHLPA
jgi:predicted O-methyltransferase YrrM